ncbi:uncharacterized protein LOC127773545 isoform X2 [Oryza glaberrima]|uniref:uncharacterized protein LOC127773545 isoform X2 n=1 Tax=Oryza glaberrima TaxID=4538 RepID=UPI00224C2EC0|nr:uncharacterized protein LOC127773545 isoform X2 [Oryza glaberrima]
MTPRPESRRHHCRRRPPRELVAMPPQTASAQKERGRTNRLLPLARVCRTKSYLRNQLSKTLQLRKIRSSWRLKPTFGKASKIPTFLESPILQEKTLKSSKASKEEFYSDAEDSDVLGESDFAGEDFEKFQRPAR